MKRLRGVVPAMLTHFDRCGGIDEAATREHLDFLVDSGVHGIFALGTTGEFFTMEGDERRRVAELVVEAADGRLPVYIHVGANSTHGTVALARHAREIGADGIAAVTPYFFGLSQECLVRYYEELASSVGGDFPVYLYNIPGCAGNDMSEQTVLALSEIPNIVGVKSSTPDFLRGLELVRHAEPGFDIIVGHDTAFLAALSCGIPGCISGNANAIPELFVRLYDAFRAGDLDAARACDRTIARLATLMRNGRNFSYLRATLALRGLARSYSRPPLPNISLADEDALYPELDSALREAGLSTGS